MVKIGTSATKTAKFISSDSCSSNALFSQAGHLHASVSIFLFFTPFPKGF